jgi:hypothetical protein
MGRSVHLLMSLEALRRGRWVKWKKRHALKNEELIK